MLTGVVGVRVARNVAETGYTWVNEDFYQDEVLLSNIPDNQEFIEQRSQSGAPTLFRLGDNYKKVVVQFKLNRPGTLQKLKNLRDWTADGGRLLVYPSYNVNPTLYYDCVLQPGGIPDHLFFKGMRKASDVLTVVFLEFQKNAPIVEE